MAGCRELTGFTVTNPVAELLSMENMAGLYLLATPNGKVKVLDELMTGNNFLIPPLLRTPSQRIIRVELNDPTISLVVPRVSCQDAISRIPLVRIRLPCMLILLNKRAPEPLFNSTLPNCPLPSICCCDVPCRRTPPLTLSSVKDPSTERLPSRVTLLFPRTRLPLSIVRFRLTVKLLFTVRLEVGDTVKS